MHVIIPIPGQPVTNSQPRDLRSVLTDEIQLFQIVFNNPIPSLVREDSLPSLHSQRTMPYSVFTMLKGWVTFTPAIRRKRIISRLQTTILPVKFLGNTIKRHSRSPIHMKQLLHTQVLTRAEKMLPVMLIRTSP